MRAETSDLAAASPFSTSCSQRQSWGGIGPPPWPPTLCPNLSLNGPDDPKAVGFGEAWQHMGNSVGQGRGEGCQ